MPRQSAAILWALFLAQMSLADGLAPFEPPAGCYIGAYIELDPVAKNDIAAFERLTGKKHATYFQYVGYGQPFPFEWANRVSAAGAAVHIAWEPNQGLEVVRDDEYLRGWAEACAHFGQPMFLRFASEMNGDWETYSGDPDLYVAKWRLVYDVIHRVAPNVAMMWCPYATPKSTIPLYYPGDDYVDWVGVNVYSVVYHQGDIDKRAVDSAVQHLAFMHSLYADSKPIAVGEYAATHFCKATGEETVDFAVAEMRRMYESIETRFPRVRMINWFSVDTLDNGLANNNYAVTDNEIVLATYRSLINSPYFLSNVVSGGVALAGALGPAVALPGAALAPGALPVLPTGLRPAAGPPVTPTPAPEGTEPVAAPPPKTTVPLAFAVHAAPSPNQVAIVVRGGEPIALDGPVEVEAVLGSALRVGRVIFELDGSFQGLSTFAPYSFPWNAANAPPGEHVVRAIVKNDAGAIIAETVAALVVAERQ